LGQQRLGVLATGQCPVQPGVETIDDRGLDEERAQVVVDAAEDLVGEVVEDEALAATEDIDDRGGIRSVRQGDGRQMQARSSTSRPWARRRASGSGGSSRVSGTRWTNGGPCSMRKRTRRWIGSALMTW
jgi:hypothetical protein